MTVLHVILGVLVFLIVVSAMQRRRDWQHPQRLHRAARRGGHL